MSAPLGYAAAHDLLEALVAARRSHDGDAFVACFTEDALVRPDPFEPALAGHNALRAYLLAAAEREVHLDLAIERHWVAGDAVLAAWHASWNTREGGKVRRAGMLVAESASDGRIAHLRAWFAERVHPG